MRSETKLRRPPGEALQAPGWGGPLPRSVGYLTGWRSSSLASHQQLAPSLVCLNAALSLAKALDRRQYQTDPWIGPPRRRLQARSLQLQEALSIPHDGAVLPNSEYF